MNTFITSCPHCKTQLQVPIEGAGQAINCPACSQRFTIFYPVRSTPMMTTHSTTKTRSPFPAFILLFVIIFLLCGAATFAYIIESNRKLDLRVDANLRRAANNGSFLAYADAMAFHANRGSIMRTWNFKSWRWNKLSKEREERLQDIYKRYK